MNQHIQGDEPAVGTIFLTEDSLSAGIVGKVMALEYLQAYVVLFRVPPSWFDDGVKRDPESVGRALYSLNVMTVAFQDRRWQTTGLATVNEELWLPVYKMRVRRINWYVTNYHRDRSRLASPSEVAELPLRSTSTPEVLEHLVSCEAGLAEYLPIVNELRTDGAILESSAHL